MKVELAITRKMIMLSAALLLLTSCALPHHSHVDVSSPSGREYIESDVLVDVPISTAYQNILSKAPSCWCSPFSGQVVAYSDTTGSTPSRISFVVPGKVLGSKVELVSVRLYPQEGNRTRIVGSSFVYPGDWQLNEAANWASGLPSLCASQQDLVAAAR